MADHSTESMTGQFHTDIDDVDQFTYININSHKTKWRPPQNHAGMMSTEREWAIAREERTKSKMAASTKTTL